MREGLDPPSGRPGPAYVVLVRSKANPALLQLYVVGTSSGALAKTIAQRTLGPEVIVELGHSISSEVAKALGLMPGEVRKF